jgi:hypothetical protein
MAIVDGFGIVLNYIADWIAWQLSGLFPDFVPYQDSHAE